MSKPLVAVEDFQKLALEKLPQSARDYYESGSDDEITLRDNVAAYQRYKLRPRVLRDVNNVDLTTTFLGATVSSPVCIAPSAMQKLAHPEGELGTAAAARATNTLMCLSTYSTTAMEDVVAPSLNKPNQGAYWFQLYVYENRATSEWIIKRAEKAGFTALVVTVDTPMLGRRRKDLRNKFSLPPHLTLANFPPNLGISSLSARTSNPDLAASQAADDAVNALGGGSGGNNSEIAIRVGNTSDKGMTWSNLIPWLRSVTKLKIVLKGIMTAEDALLGAEWGVDGIIVSNHGGRQLDTNRATLDVLPEIMHALRSSTHTKVPEVFMDGGIRKGADIVKALCLGARAVFIGRPVLWGLSHAGGDGVKEVLGVLNEELKVALALLGCQRPSELGETYLFPSPKL